MIVVWSVIGIVAFLVLLWVVFTKRLFTRRRPVGKVESFVRWQLFSKLGISCLSAVVAGAGLGAFYYGANRLMIACALAAYGMRLWRIAAPRAESDNSRVLFATDEAVDKSVFTLILLLVGSLCLHFVYGQTWANSFFVALNGTLILVCVLSLLLYNLIGNFWYWVRMRENDRILRKAAKEDLDDEDF